MHSLLSGSRTVNLNDFPVSTVILGNIISSGGEGQPTTIDSTTLDVTGSGTYATTVNLNTTTQASLAKADKIVTTGDGNSYLANDGTYKTVGGSVDTVRAFSNYISPFGADSPQT
jgi:hypothetical protein